MEDFSEHINVEFRGKVDKEERLLIKPGGMPVGGFGWEIIDMKASKKCVDEYNGPLRLERVKTKEEAKKRKEAYLNGEVEVPTQEFTDLEPYFPENILMIKEGGEFQSFYHVPTVDHLKRVALALLKIWHKRYILPLPDGEEPPSFPDIGINSEDEIDQVPSELRKMAEEKIDIYKSELQHHQDSKRLNKGLEKTLEKDDKNLALYTFKDLCFSGWLEFELIRAEDVESVEERVDQ